MESQYISDVDECHC